MHQNWEYVIHIQGSYVEQTNNKHKCLNELYLQQHRNHQQMFHTLAQMFERMWKIVGRISGISERSNEHFLISLANEMIGANGKWENV